MTWIPALRHQADKALLATARSSQALVIESLSRTMEAASGKLLAPVKRSRQVQTAIATRLVDDPAKFVDDGYDVLGRLLALHREFAQRLFDVVDPRETRSDRSSEPDDGVVVPFASVRTRAHS